MPTLKASKLGIAKIRQARNEKGWSWSIEDNDAILVEASRVLEPEKHWLPDGPYASGVSEGTWKRFLAGRQPIRADVFKAYCKVLELNWEEIVNRDSATVPNLHQDWGSAIDSSSFYGRKSELAQLEQWIVKEHCRLVAVLGMGGIGKTALAVKLAERVQHSFGYLIWRSLRHAPPVQDTLADLIKFFSDEQDIDLPETVSGRISRLLEHLRAKRGLLLFDEVETVLRSGELAGQYRESYEGYGELIERVGEERHQSCLILISREKPIEISSLAGLTLPVRALRLQGLQKEDAKKLLKSKGFSSMMRGAEELIELYRGNPLVLKIITTTIQEVFDGNISQFVEENTLVIGDIIPTILSQQFERLSTLENLIIYELALANRPISLQQLRLALRFSAPSLSKLLPALESLKRRSLLEEEKKPGKGEPFFTLQPVIMKYVKTQLLDRICKDIFTTIETQSINQLGLLRSLDLVKEQEKQNVAYSSIYFPLAQVIERLNMALGSADQIEEPLNNVLSMLQNKPSQAVGYAQSNIVKLLMVAEGELQRL